MQVSGLTGVQAIASGHSHNLALKSDGTVWAWGYNNAGQLGDGTYTERTTPVRVSGLTGVQAIAAGGLHNLAMVEDTTVPKVTEIQPSAGAIGVSRNTLVVAHFSEYVDKSTLTGTLGKSNFKLFRMTATGPVRVTDVTVKPNRYGTKATLNPYGASTQRLEGGTRYKVVVTTGVTDLVGNPMATNKVWYFTTGS
jgi:hypothetical protein